MASKGKSFFVFSYMVTFILSNASSRSLLEIIENGCMPSGILCRTTTSFTYCTKMGDNSLLIGNEFFCPEGYICNEFSKYPCVLPEDVMPDTTLTEIVSTTEISLETVSEVTDEIATETTTEIINEVSTEITTESSAEITTASSTEIITELTTEILSESTIKSTSQPITEITVNTTPEPVTTTTKKPIQPPVCIGKGFHAGPSCDEYYECVSSGWWSYKPVLKACAEGSHFSTASKACVPQEESNCVD